MRIIKSLLKKTVVPIALLLACVTALSGCFFNRLLNVPATGIRFTDRVPAAMKLGEELQLTAEHVTVLPALASDKSFSLSSSRPEVLAVNTSTNRVKAVGVGQATLTATGNDGGFTAEKTVTVDYAAANSLTIGYDKNAYTVAGSGIVLFTDEADRTVRLSAAVSENADPSTPVRWTVAFGQSVTPAVEKKAYEPFSFDAGNVGVYRVSAAVERSGAAVLTESLAVHVCEPITDAALTCTGSLEQNEGRYAPVRFELSYTNPAGNPAALVEWRADGKTVAGDGATFTYTPTLAGTHTVAAYLNGRLAGSERIVARGSIIPQNVWVDYDNCYPKVYIRWDEISQDLGYEIEIKDASGAIVSSDIDTREHPELKDRFTRSSFDATDLMGAGLFTGTYTVRVRTLGDSVALTGSAWSDSAATKKLPEAARTYLAQSYYDGKRNYYITDDLEFLDWFTYGMIWRSESVSPPAVGQSSAKLYMGYNYVTQFLHSTDESAVAVRNDSRYSGYSNEEKFLTYVFSNTHYTGLYNFLAVPSGNTLTVVISFYSDGLPSKRTTGNSPDAWNALRPHVNVDESKARPSDHVFPIDARSPVAVTTSEQLYTVAEKGFCPRPAAGSAADTLYAYARRLLRSILTDGMTDEQKLHAIYDWVMWRVTYDTRATQIKGTVDTAIDAGTREERQNSADLRETVKYEAYYLESVLTDTGFYSVCDGMSKAYSLLCNIEGLECMRIAGEGLGYDEYGNPAWFGHAWNKVKLNGEWYVVDCTWGDMSVALKDGYQTAEVASHAYFLLTDDEIAADHREDDSLHTYPATAETPYDFYDSDISYNGSTVDFYIDVSSSGAAQTEVDALVAYMLETAQGKPETYAVGPDKDTSANRVTGTYYGFDVRVSARTLKAVSGFSWINSGNPFEIAMAKYSRLSGRDYEMTTVGGNDNSIYTFVFIDLSRL